MNFYLPFSRPLLLLLLVVIVLPLPAQDGPLFPSNEAFDDGMIDLPLTYGNKEKEAYTIVAKELKEVEVIYLK